MKKFLAICLTLIMVISITLSATAAPTGFVSSPSASQGPTVAEFTQKSDDCTAKLVITPYSNRESLPEEVLNAMNDAYNQVVNNGADLTKLNSALAALAKKNNIPAADLAVSDLFDITSYDCTDHDAHNGFDITLKDDSLKNFVALLHLKGGKWELVENAKVNGSHLIFSVDSLSPFAVVVNNGNAVTSPQTGSNSRLVVYAFVMVLSAVCLAVVWNKSRKIAD